MHMYHWNKYFLVLVILENQKKAFGICYQLLLYLFSQICLNFLFLAWLLIQSIIKYS